MTSPVTTSVITRQCARLPIALAICCSVVLSATLVVAAPAARPNILWITSEDTGPELGCYGDTFADTPHLDELAGRGMIYRNAWSNAPVCAPARTTIICGVYPTSTGSSHMRSMISLPAGFQLFPQLLRAAGYYCTNNSKEDYNVAKPGRIWDDSSARAHWKNRAAGQPFFAVFNITATHESQIRSRPHTLVHDPAKVPIPAYHPDAPEVRQDWTQYYDKITEMDGAVGKLLGELNNAGLADETIVFYSGDHGSGMPRSKRWLYQSGLNVPLIVHIPSKFRELAPAEYAPGGSSDRLVAFIDLAPTMLSLAGVEPPEYYQGDAFLGPAARPAQEFIFGFRDRMDERIDMSRAVRDGRYLYIRNFYPHKPQGQFLDYMFQTPTTRAWKKLFDEGRLTPEQSAFWRTKPPEELYDLANDRWQVHNLVESPNHVEALERLRIELRRHLLDVRDLGFMPEAEMHRRSGNRAPYDVGHDSAQYPLERIYDTAVLAAAKERDANTITSLARLLGDEDACVRYWAALGLLTREQEACTPNSKLLTAALDDPSPSVRIVAATALCRYAEPTVAGRALDTLVQLADIESNSVQVAVEALNAIDDLDEKALPAIDRIRSLPKPSSPRLKRYDNYVERLLEKIVADFEK